MPGLNKALRESLKHARKTAVLGVGSELKTDDAVGMHTARKIDILRKRSPSKKIKVFLGSTAPENFTGAIERYRPTHLVVIDAADLGLKPGQAGMIDVQDIEGASFSTHMLPLKIVIDFIKTAVSCEAVIIGIQPKSTEFGLKMSREARTAAGRVAEAVVKAVRGGNASSTPGPRTRFAR